MSMPAVSFALFPSFQGLCSAPEHSKDIRAIESLQAYQSGLPDEMYVSTHISVNISGV